VEVLEGRELLSAGTARIVTYNIEADINGVTTPRPGLYEVLEGIGEEQVQGNYQPLDILALQETTSNATTVAPIVANLNSYYNGLASYAQSPYQATQSGGNSSGNGPNALVYNTGKLTLLASVGVGTPQGSANGEYRQVVRYQFQPVGASGSAGVFYLYTSHAKAGTGSTNANLRNLEAQIIRNDEATLPAGARVLYTGDFNVDGSSDASYQTMAAATSPGGVAQGAGFDPLNRPGNWATNPAFQDILSESATDLRFRDDLELVTQNVLNAAPGGLGYVAGSYHTFGVNGSTPVFGSVNSGSNTSLNNDLVQDGPTFIPASALYADLTTASDHLPVVADYTLGAMTATTTALTSSVNPSVYGQPVTFTATVSGSGGTPTGTVTFKDGAATLGTGALNGSGVAVFSTSALGAGNHGITASYGGDANFTASTSSVANEVINPGNLVVTNFTTTPNGFRATFSAALDAGVLNVFAAPGGTGPADVTLVGNGTGPVSGSLQIDPTGAVITFIKTGGYRTGNTDFTKFLLAPDAYTATFRSAPQGTGDNGGFRDNTPSHNLLAGDGSTPGTNYTATFTVGSSTARVVSVPDFARGFHQAVNVATPTTGSGIPLTLSDGTGVSSIALDFVYDPTVLTVTGGAPQAGFTGTIDAGTPGVVHVSLTGTGSAGALTFATLTATVPDTAPYKNKEVLDLRNVSLNGGAVAAVADDGVHVAAFLGDADGSMTYTAQDAFTVNQVTVGATNGLAAYQLLDPVVVGDTDGNGSVNSQDAFTVSQKAIGASVPQIPDPPTGVTAPPAGGPDPVLSFGDYSGAPGSTVTVAVNLSVTDPNGLLYNSDDLAIVFDPTRFQVSNIRSGSLFGEPANVATAANPDNTAGTIRIGQYRLALNPLSYPQGTNGPIVLIDFLVLAGDAPGTSSPLNISQNVSSTFTDVNGGAATLNPSPTNAPDDPGVDGVFSIVAGNSGGTGALPPDATRNARRTVSRAVPQIPDIPGEMRFPPVDLVFHFDPSRPQALTVQTGLTRPRSHTLADVDTLHELIRTDAPAGGSATNRRASFTGARTQLSGGWPTLSPGLTDDPEADGLPVV
jgi:hypothetical protein